MKKIFLEISQKSLENTCARGSFIIKLQAFINKETLAQVFSCEFWKNPKNTFYYRTPLVAFSVTIIIEYAWICLNKEGSEYTSGSKYAKILNRLGSQYVSVTQRSEYVKIYITWQSSEYISSSKFVRILNMAGFWTCRSYTGF